MLNKQAIINKLNIPAIYSAGLPSLKLNGSGKEEAMALCLWHDDTKPSLSINLNTGLFYCHSCRVSGGIFDFFMKVHEVDFKTAFSTLAKEAGVSDSASTPRKIVSIYNYTDEHRKLLFQTVRYEPKDFKQRRQDGKGGWTWNLKDTPLVPYNLPGVLKAQGVFIVEGEADADRLKKIGLTATCNPMGAGKWKPEFNQYFKDKKVVIVSDNDEPGRKHAQIVAMNLKGMADFVKVLNLPGLPEKGDVSDWLNNGGTKGSLIELTKKTAEWKEEPNPGLVMLDTVEPETVHWLWQGYIPLGKLSILDGDPNVGKSLITLDLIARVTSNRPMPDGSQGCGGGAVIMSVEDGLADTVVPRLKAAGADLSKVVALQGVGTKEGGLRFPTVEDVEAISNAIKKVHAKIVVIDPLAGFLPSDCNSWKDQDIRLALNPIVKMAEDEGVAVKIVRHLTKSNHTHAIYRGGGSIGIVGVARTAFLVAKDPEDEERRILAGVKNNLAQMPPSLKYVIENQDGIPLISWQGTSTHTASELLSIPDSQEERSALGEAKEFLGEILSEGDMESKEIQGEARQAGIAEKTLQRAKKVLGVISKRDIFGKGGKWLWCLGGQEKPKADNIYNDCLRGDLATLGETNTSDEQQNCPGLDNCDSLKYDMRFDPGTRKLEKFCKPTGDFCHAKKVEKTTKESELKIANPASSNNEVVTVLEVSE